MPRVDLKTLTNTLPIFVVLPPEVILLHISLWLEIGLIMGSIKSVVIFIPKSFVVIGGQII
jgi:hypothetical protein